MYCTCPAPSRVVLPDSSAGWRKNSQSGVDRETPGHSTSSLQSQGSIHRSPPQLCLTACTFADSFSVIYYIFMKVLVTQQCESLLFPKGKHLWTASPCGGSQHFSNDVFLWVNKKRLSPRLDKKRIPDIAFDWHPIMLTVMAKCFFATMSTAQHFFCPPHINSLSLPHSRFRSLFYLHISAMSGVSRGRKGVSPTEFCVISATCWIHHFPLFFSPFFLHSSSPTRALICASLLFVRKMWLWSQHQDPSLPPQHHNMPPTPNPMGTLPDEQLFEIEWLSDSDLYIWVVLIFLQWWMVPPT